MSRYHTASIVETQIEPRMRHLLADLLSGTDDIGWSEGDATLGALARQAAASHEGGKRLRALLTLAAYQAFSSERQRSRDRLEPNSAGQIPPERESCEYDDAALDIACAIELYQTSALIHDDIIDESAMRRGKPSAHAALSALMDDRRQGDALALMLGNMFATASARIATSAFHRLGGDISGPHAFFDMQRAVQIGQSLDLSLERLPMDAGYQAQAALQVYRWKTASYTTIAPIELGAMAAGMEPGYARRISCEIGLPLGLAFQLADDLLDVLGDTRSTGKPTGGDIREGKRTVLLADAIAGSDASGQTRLMRIMGAEQRDDRDVAEVTGIYASSGAIDVSRRRIATLVDSSHSALESLGLSTAARAVIDAACSPFIPDIDG